MDLPSLLAERERVTDDFRATLTYLAMLRAQLARDLSEEAPQHLLSVIDEEAAESRRLSGELLQLDGAILKMQAAPNAASSASPLLLTPRDS